MRTRSVCPCMEQSDPIPADTQTNEVVEIEEVFARLTMVLEDAAGLAADGQAQGQPDSMHHNRARQIISYLNQAFKLTDLIIQQTDDRNG